MSDTNDLLVLISGESGTGKSASLRNLENQERWMYLNCESGKRLPFRNAFKTFKVDDPYQVYEGFDHATANPNDWDGVVVDTSTFLMDMYESKYIVGSANTQKAWGDYAQFFKNLMQDKVVKFNKPVIILAHTLSVYDEKTLDMRTSVPVKGALKNNGIEAYFSTVVSTRKMSVKELSDYSSAILTITEEEEMLGYKHVFQTKPTKKTVGDRIRSPMGMFSNKETYMDNDANLLMKHLKEYYGITA